MVQNNNQTNIKNILGELTPGYLSVFFICYMLFIFEPLQTYSANIVDFWFDMGMMARPVIIMFLCFFAVGILIVTAIYFISCRYSKRLLVYKLFVLIAFIVYFMLYIQGNWLSGNLSELNGEEIDWKNSGKTENYIFIASVAVLCIAAFVCVKRFKLKRVLIGATAVGAVTCAMLTCALVTTVITNKAYTQSTFIPTFENFNEISASKNFLIFLADTTDSRAFYEVMSNDEDFREMFDDFTYYPDTMSLYPFTMDSLPQILTGAITHYNMNHIDFCTNAYNNSPLFEKLSENGYEMNIYSTLVQWAGDKNFDIANAISINDVKINTDVFIRQELKYIAFKYLPYGLKRFSRINTLDFNLCKTDTVKSSELYNWEIFTIYDQIKQNPTLTKKNENYFQFVHCAGAHPAFNMDKNLNIIENGTYEQKNAASLTLIKAYLQRLKDNNAYDNSVIIIMSDHGYPAELNYFDNELAYEEKYMIPRYNPMLLIKGFNERHPMVKSSTPVSYADLQEVFGELIDGKSSTELFTDISAARERVLYYRNNEDEPLAEYSTTGKAWETQKYTPTGIKYYPPN